LLGQVGELYAGALDEVTRVLADLDLEPGGRPKTVGTLVDKLRRMPELPLSKMQDIAGARVVAEMTREEQDRLVERITARFDSYRVKDRRIEPSFGYRAVHIIVRVQGRPVEIQVRTRLQDLWAQIVERLADAWGRQIRYGEPPSEPDLRLRELTRQQFVDGLMQLSSAVDEVERAKVLLAELDRLDEELRARGEEPELDEEMAAVRAQLEGRERRLRATLERLHGASTRGTLAP